MVSKIFQTFCGDKKYEMFRISQINVSDVTFQTVMTLHLSWLMYLLLKISKSKQEETNFRDTLQYTGEYQC